MHIHKQSWHRNITTREATWGRAKHGWQGRSISAWICSLDVSNLHERRRLPRLTANVVTREPAYSLFGFASSRPCHFPARTDSYSSRYACGTTFCNVPTSWWWWYWYRRIQIFSVVLSYVPTILRPLQWSDQLFRFLGMELRTYVTRTRTCTEVDATFGYYCSRTVLYDYRQTRFVIRETGFNNLNIQRANTGRLEDCDSSQQNISWCEGVYFNVSTACIF